MTDVVSVGDLYTPTARARRAAWMRRFDVGTPPAPHPPPIIRATPVPLVLTEDNPVTPVAPQALALAGPAAANGWFVEIFYSRGTVLLAGGKRGRLADVTSIRAFRFPGQHAAVTWGRVVDNNKERDWEAGDGWLWKDNARPRSVGVAAVKDVMGGADLDDLVRLDLAKPAPNRGACSVCGQLTSVNKNGTLRVHGPRDSRCAGRYPSATT